MAKTKKFYVVWQGHQSGIYDNWSECKNQIKGFPNAKYKSFMSLAEAQLAFRDSYTNHYNYGAQKKSKKTSIAQFNNEIIKDSIAVDAACSGANGPMEYQGVVTVTGQLLFRKGPYQDGTNNVGEFLGLVHAMAYLQNQKNTTTAIYSDSRTAMAWVRKKKANTTLKRTGKNDDLFTLISRAEIWLKANPFPNKILKWETKTWGEIPADFGRK